MTEMYFVYVDWTCEEPPRAFYVGYGNAARVKGKRRNKHHTNLKEKYGMKREVVHTFDNETLAQRREVELIAYYKTFVYAVDYVFGCNYTVGGDGSRGHRQPSPTTAHRLAISIANSHPKSEETKALMKIEAQKRASDPVWIQKMREVSIERWQNPEYREKFSASTTGQKRSDEQCQHMSLGQTLAWEDVDKRARASQSAKRRYENPEERELLSAKVKLRWQDPAYRAKRKASRAARLEQKAQSCQN